MKLSVKQIIYIITMFCVFSLVGCAVEDKSFSDDHPRFPDTSTNRRAAKNASATTTQSSRVIGGSGGGSSYSEYDPFSTARTPLGSSKYASYEEDEKIEILINDSTNTLVYIEYIYYDNIENPSSSFDSSKVMMKVEEIYSYEKLGQHKGGEVIKLTLKQTLMTASDDIAVRAAKILLGANDILDWVPATPKDVTSYYKDWAHFSFSPTQSVKIEGDHLYMAIYLEGVGDWNKDARSGSVYIKE